jgi:hypothetical protein
MPSECRFRDDGTKATRFYKLDAGDDRMKEHDEDVVHVGIVSKSQKIPEFRPILEFATDMSGVQPANRDRGAYKHQIDTPVNYCQAEDQVTHEFGCFHNGLPRRHCDCKCRTIQPQ